MFNNEADFRNFIKSKLEKQGFKVRSEFYLYKTTRVDLLAEREEEVEEKLLGFTISRKKIKAIKAIEVKFDRAKIMDALSYAVRLKILPHVTESYLAIPKILLNQDHLAFAKRSGVGIIGATEKGIEWILKAEIVRPLDLRLSFGHPTQVSSGEIFEIRVSIVPENKIAPNVYVRYIPTGPFKRPKGEKHSQHVGDLSPDERSEIKVKVEVKSQSRTGKYPLFLKVMSDGFEHESILNIQIGSPK